MRRALVVGIDHYERQPLATCENDATVIAKLLAENEDGGANFDVRLLVQEHTDITRRKFLDAIKALFGRPAEVALLYFAGHCAVDETTGSAALITPDQEDDAHGVTLADIMAIANQTKGTVQSVVIILDCCQAGAAGEMQGFDVSALGQGVTILASCDRSETAASNVTNGVFSELVAAGIEGAAADVQGFVTPAAVYALVDQSLGAWEQRPVYKANVQQFVSLRRCKPKVSGVVLKKLPKLFPTPDHVFDLDPSFEPKASKEAIAGVPDDVRTENMETFAALQTMNRNGLITPVGEDHMYYAAINGAGCTLTKLGRHYWRLSSLKNIHPKR